MIDSLIRNLSARLIELGAIYVDRYNDDPDAKNDYATPAVLIELQPWQPDQQRGNVIMGVLTLQLHVHQAHAGGAHRTEEGGNQEAFIEPFTLVEKLIKGLNFWRWNYSLNQLGKPVNVKSEELLFTRHTPPTSYTTHLVDLIEFQTTIALKKC